MSEMDYICIQKNPKRSRVILIHSMTNGCRECITQPNVTMILWKKHFYLRSSIHSCQVYRFCRYFRISMARWNGLFDYHRKWVCHCVNYAAAQACTSCPAKAVCQLKTSCHAIRIIICACHTQNNGWISYSFVKKLRNMRCFLPQWIHEFIGKVPEVRLLTWNNPP